MRRLLAQKTAWVEKSLEEIGFTQTGSTPQTKRRENYGTHIPFIKPADFTADGTLKYDNDGLSEEGLRAARRVEGGSLLMVCIGATIGKCGFCDREITTNQQINSLTPRDGSSNMFIYYQMLTESFQRRVLQKSAQATLPIINKSKWSALTLTLPAPSEQRRIVGILDEAFEGIATAKANAEKNLQNARALFESHLQSVFTQRGDGWAERRLGEVCDFEGGSQPPKSQFIYAPKAGYVRFLQIRDFGSDKHITYIPESAKNRSCCEDDIMIGRYGASVGKILKGRSGAYNVALMKTVPDPEVLDRDFFHQYLVSSSFQDSLRRVADRSAQNGFSKEDIFPFPVPVPSLQEQRTIVGRLGPFRDETNHLASIYQQKLAALDELKKSLLHQAFSGNL